MGVRDVRNQGVFARRSTTSVDSCSTSASAARWRGDHAVPLLHVRHDPQRPSTGGSRWEGAGAPARDHGLPPRLRDAAHRLRRAVRREAVRNSGGEYDRERGITYGGRRTTAPASRSRRRGAGAHVRVLRPDPHRCSEAGQDWWRSTVLPTASPPSKPATASTPDSLTSTRRHGRAGTKVSPFARHRSAEFSREA